ncbi:hypothetical protein EMIT0215P_10017 [Pseudomonas serboccidentalis]
MCTHLFYIGTVGTTIKTRPKICMMDSDGLVQKLEFPKDSTVANTAEMLLTGGFPPVTLKIIRTLNLHS